MIAGQCARFYIRHRPGHLGSHNVANRLAYLLGPDYFTHHFTHHLAFDLTFAESVTLALGITVGLALDLAVYQPIDLTIC